MFGRKKASTVNNGAEMSFLEHLEEMRGVILRSISVFVLALIGVLVCFHYFNALMMYPLNSAKKLLAVYTGASEHKIEAKTDKIGPVFLVKEGADGKEIKDGPFWILPKEDGQITLTAEGISQAGTWYNDIKLRSMTFATPIIVYFYVGFLGALGISLPAMLYFTAKFVAPGLKEEELRLMMPAMVIAVLLFALGSAFAFLFILPAGIAFMSWMAQGMNLEMFPDAQSYYSLVIFVTIAIGITFELPLVVIILIYLGVLNPDWLKKNRRIVFVIILIFAAIVTPPDVITQISLTIPLYLMYEASLVIGERLRKKKLAKEAREERLAEIEDEKERREYAREIARERLEEQAREAEYDADSQSESSSDDIGPIDTSHYELQQDFGTRDTSDPAYDYAYDDNDSDEDYGIESYIDYGKLSRPTPQFAPDWSLNKKDYSYMSPNWELNSAGQNADTSEVQEPPHDNVDKNTAPEEKK